MTSNPLQPQKSNDESSTRTAPAVGSTSVANPSQPSKTPQSATQRDEGTRSFRAVPEVAATVAPKVGGSAEVLACLNTISEFVGKARKALGAMGQDGVSQATDRQTNEGGPRASKTEDAARNPSTTSPV